MHTTSSGQGHETLVGTVVGEVLEVDPDKVRVTRPDSLVGAAERHAGRRAAWRSCWAAAAFHAAGKLKEKLITIGAHDLGIPRERAVYAQGAVYDRNAPDKRIGWDELITIAHRNYHRMPPGMEPGLAAEHIEQVPTGGTLPTKEGYAHIYPCVSFEFHLLLLTLDPELGTPQILRYRIGHDCGTIINPEDRARHDHGRRRARHRRRALRGIRL